MKVLSFQGFRVRGFSAGGGSWTSEIWLKVTGFGLISVGTLNPRPYSNSNT